MTLSDFFREVVCDLRDYADDEVEVIVSVVKKGEPEVYTPLLSDLTHLDLDAFTDLTRECAARRGGVKA